MAGYSQRPLHAKLGLKPGQRAAVENEPDGYRERLLADAPAVAWLPVRAGELDFLHAFYRDAAQLAHRLPQLRSAIRPAGMIWISWPKKASGVATDLSGDVVRELALRNRLVDVKVCAVDETWSGLKLVIRTKDRP